MSKTGYKELAQALVDKYGLERAAAEQFVEKMFGVLVEGIASDRQVKVKGLGTFKVVPVAARKSVDVNTGEPIVIEGRDKVTFTPDNAMRDLVNRPFSQFETVPINDGVDFTAIDERFADPDAALESFDEAVGPEPKPKEQEEQEKQEEPDAPDAPAQEAPAPAEETPVPAEEAPVPAEETPAPAFPSDPAPLPNEPTMPNRPNRPNRPNEPNRPNKPIEPNEPNEPIMPNEPIAPSEETPSSAADSAPEVCSPVAEAERQADEARNQLILLQQEMARQHRFMRWFLGVAVVLLLACVGGIFYLFTQLTQRDHRIEHLESEAILASRTPQGRAILDATVDTTAVAQAHRDSLEAARKLKAEEAARQHAAEQAQAPGPSAPAAVQPSAAAKTPATSPATVAKKGASSSALQQAKAKPEKPAAKVVAKENAATTTYNKDVRIRTGAYDIVGIERTVVAKAGQTLEGISRTQLGPGMECYIEAVNAGRTQLKAGDKVNIPRLKLKKKR